MKILQAKQHYAHFYLRQHTCWRDKSNEIEKRERPYIQTYTYKTHCILLF